MGNTHDPLRKLRESLSSDAIAGLTVACVALPLNLALALASGVPASMGLVSGIVAGVVAALLGGVRLQITGPEAALVPVVYAIALQYGPRGVVLATCLCGAAQIGLGLAKVGSFVRFIPVPVVRGFMAGIGVLIVVSQCGPLLGVAAGDTAALAAQLTRGYAWLAPLAIGAVAALCMASIPAFGALAGLALATAFALLMHADLRTVGVLPDALPWPRAPALAGLDVKGLLPLALSLTFVASLGSLLAAAAVQALVKQRATQASYDRELIAQGVANLACGLFGGLPVMGAIVRSAVGVEAGARTRASACFQALFLLAAMMFGGALVAQVPIAALAGILMLVGVRLMGLGALRTMWATRRGEVAVIVVTAGVIASTTFYLGIAAGLLAAAALQLVRVGPLQVTVRALRGEQEPPRDAGLIHVAEVRGALVFNAAARVDAILGDRPPWPAYLVLDLRRAWTIDSTGLFALQHVLDCLEARGGRFALVALPGSAVASALERRGLVARGLGGTCCASAEQALEVIAEQPRARTSVADAVRPPRSSERQHADVEPTVQLG